MSTIHNQAKARREEKSYQVYHILFRVKYTLQVGTNLETKYRKKKHRNMDFSLVKDKLKAFNNFRSK